MCYRIRQIRSVEETRVDVEKGYECDEVSINQMDYKEFMDGIRVRRVLKKWTVRETALMRRRSINVAPTC